jgi:hypothetical protein
VRETRLVGLLLTLGALAACSPVDNHLLEGQQYVASGACLDPAQAIDDVGGPDPGTCAPTCLVASEDGGPVVIITTTCGPYPSYFTSESPDAATATSDPCKGAFAAYAAGTVCLPDGGAPDAHAEGGADAEAGADAHADADAGAEAAADAPAGG